MANTVTTTLKVKSDDREVRKLAATVGKAFDPKHAKELKQATRELERQFGDAAKRQGELIRQLQAVDKGTKAYKNLKSELKGVKDQADLASKALQQIEQASNRMSRQQREGRGRNFLLGAAQGAGVAQYLPSGPGAYARLGGAAVAGGIRRGVGAAAAPFMTPGIGGLAQGLAGIPGLGGFAAGALQTGAGAYQSAVGYDRARLQNLYFANERIGQRRGQYINPKWSAAQGALTAATANRDSLATQKGELELERDRAPSVGRMAVANQMHAMAVGRIPGATARAAQVKGSPSVPQLERQGIRKEIRENKQELAAANAAVGARQRDLRGIQKFKRGGVESGLGSDRIAADLGLGPMQAQALRGQFYGVAGGEFDQSEFNTALAAQVRYGVGAQQSGQYARMGRAGGGGAGMIELGRVLKGAVLSGLKGAQVTEYLGELVNLGSTAEKQGIKVNAADFQKLSFRIKASGFEGTQIGRIAGGLTRAGQGLAQRGVQSPIDMLMMRAAGFEPGQGPEGYSKALKTLEGGDTKAYTQFLGKLVQGTQGLGENTQELLVKRAMGRAGVNVGFGQARKLITGFSEGGQQAAEPLVQAMMAARDKTGSNDQMLTEASGRVTAGAGFARTGAQLERQRVGLGRGFGFIARFESASMKSAGIMSNFGTSLTKLSTSVNKAVEAVNSFTEGGIEGLWKTLKIGVGL